LCAPRRDFRTIVRHGGRSRRTYAVVLASRDAALAASCRKSSPGRRSVSITNEDVLGVELAGAMKNVMAIAAGACQGSVSFEYSRGADQRAPG